MSLLRKSVIVVTVFLLSNFSSYSQWIPIVSGTSNHLVDGYFDNDSVGYAIGSGGTVLKTVDFGSTWVQKATLTGNFTSICPAGKDTIFVGGNSLYRSVDGGNTWSFVTNFPVIIKDLLFFGSNKGYAIYPSYQNCTWNFTNYVYDNYQIYKTINSGIAWASDFGSYDNTSRFQLIDDSTAYLTGMQVNIFVHCAGPSSNTSKKTTNRGQSWASTGQAIPWYGSKYYFVNDTLGFFMAYWNYNALFKTVNGGASITQSYTEIQDSSFAQCLFTNDIDGYTIGTKYIYETRSKGLQWNKDHTSSQALNSIFKSKKTLIAVGNSGTILKKVIVNSILPDTVYRITTTNKSIDYGYETVDSLSVVTLSLTNTGSVPLNLSLSTSLINFKVSTTSSSFQNTLAISLNPFQSQQIYVQFNPKNNISYNDTLFVTAPKANTLKIALKGIGFYGLLGTLNKDTIICVDTIRIGGNVIVKNGVKATICAGTVVKFMGDFRITVNGILKALGTPTAPVTFIRRDTTKYWSGVDVNNLSYNDTSVFNSCIMIEPCNYALINISNGYAVINKCSLRNTKSGRDAILVSGNKSRALVENNIVYDTKYFGIECNSCDSIKINNNIVHGNDWGIGGSSGRLQTVSGNQVYNNKNYGIEMNGSSLIENNIVHDNQGTGITVDGQNIIIRSNMVYNNHASSYGGMNVGSGPNTYIIQNLIFNNTADFGGSGGLNIAPSNQSFGPIYVINNTICNNKASSSSNSHDFYATSNSSYGLDILLLNNIIYNTNGLNSNMQWFSMVTYSIDYNCLNITSASGPNNINSNPQFIDPTDSTGAMFNIGNFDWRLQGSSSCINSGATLAANLTPTSDIGGWVRVNGVIDMGAYEFSPVGINEQVAFSQIKVFPNPVKNDLFLMFNNNANIKTNLYDISGRKMNCRRETYNNMIKFDLENIESGIYLLEVNLDDRKVTYKILKE